MSQNLRQENRQEGEHQSESRVGAEGEVTPEALLERDAAANPVPAEVEQRLRATLAKEPKRARPSFWRRLFGGGGR